MLGEFGEAEGLELSEKAVADANKTYAHATYIQGNALEYKLKSEHYDIIVSQEVLEHVWEQEKYLRVCFNALKPGGYLILTTPNKSVLDHMTNGGNWSNQPIENVVTRKILTRLVSKQFKILDYDTIIMNFGKQGIYGIINSRYVIGVANKLGLKKFRERVLGKRGYGLHQCVFAQKKS